MQAVRHIRRAAGSTSAARRRAAMERGDGLWYSNEQNNNARRQRLGRVFGEVRPPVWIAGPCAAENAGMMEKTVERLVKNGVTIVRAGAYKPRTSADDFQGLGRAALEIFREIRRRYGVRIVSEVVDVRHIEPMSSCVDILQVGARNMYNYELPPEGARPRLHTRAAQKRAVGHGGGIPQSGGIHPAGRERTPRAVRARRSGL